MKTITTAAELTELIRQHKSAGRKVGFVPTMGYLHDGHLALVKQAKLENDITVVSIFVNPKQFGPQEDFAKYPRNLERDSDLLGSVFTDILFFPSVDEVYPPAEPVRNVIADPVLAKLACGSKRPGHFDGVVTVVARLFDLVQPDKAYFGLKDYQQFLIIKRMSADLNYPIQIIGCPIVREIDGLAMSSRNTYLSALEHQDALILRKSLGFAQVLALQGIAWPRIKQEIQKMLETVASARIDYIEILDSESLQPVDARRKSGIVVLLAVYIGKTRLIDNIVL